MRIVAAAAEYTTECCGSNGVTTVDVLGGTTTGRRVTLAFDEGGVTCARHGKVRRGDNYVENGEGAALSGGGGATGDSGDDVCTGAGGGGGNVVLVAMDPLKKESSTLRSELPVRSAVAEPWVVDQSKLMIEKRFATGADSLIYRGIYGWQTV
ncbi:hypothetical protein GUJ93_ZPchr0003g18555 [Zizania palustris]|uniref:Uncharacterized protein n=1 Tax=Zizania palustris TaxID=103762 RepID=A0A8J5SBA7_ZIZPA|nr:hypothetical protein GUJ93_ZPchr0003g18555 [Zizania palustris]